MRSSIKCCRNCQDRQMGCHAICEKYKRQKAEWDKEKAEMRKIYELEQGVTFESIENMMKIKQKKRRQV